MLVLLKKLEARRHWKDEQTEMVSDSLILKG
jgi:hypothetical protein